MHIRSWVNFLGVALMVVACGDDEEEKPAAQPATVNKQAAASSATATISTLSAALGSDPSSSAASLASVAQSSQSLLTPSAGAGGAQTKSALTFGGGIEPLEFNGEGCTCTETGCTFTNCSPTGAGSQSSFTIDGSYSWGGGHIECKSLKYTFKSSATGAAAGVSSDTTITLNCDLTITSTSLNGFIQSAGSSSTNIAGQNTQAAYSTSWDVKTTYSSVTFGDNKQPTGGSLKVDGTTSVTAGGQKQDFAGSAEVTFPVQ